MTDFFKRAATEPFVWGENDCALWVASYVFEITGTDPAMSLRGRYKTALGCRRLLNMEGGLLALSVRLMVGFESGHDVGVFEFQGQQIAGIMKNNKVGFKMPKGLMVVPAPELLKGWKICHKL